MIGQTRQRASHSYNRLGRRVAKLIDPPPGRNKMPRIAAISIYVNDMDKAIAFYRDVLGFAVRARPVPYITELEHESPELILCQAERPSRNDYPNAAGTVVGIASTNVAARAQELAKKKVDLVHSEPQDFPGGKFIALRDPAGNVVELLEFSA